MIFLASVNEQDEKKKRGTMCHFMYTAGIMDYFLSQTIYIKENGFFQQLTKSKKHF